jgi:hypothetical protein
VVEECYKFAVTASEADLERMALAGYNQGANASVHYFRRREDVDTGTTDQNYSAAVLRYAQEYAELAAALPQNLQDT